MKKVLVLGAGLVARPMVKYLLGDNLAVWVASRTVSKALELVGKHPNGKALALLADDEPALDKLVAQADLVVSLLPYTHHVKVANHCLKHRKHLVTTSYVSDAMRALDADARQAGLLFLNEIGLDPGIDHMSAMKIIRAVQSAKGKVTSFMSYCGGLPAPEANDNPFGYKFSWSPRGVVMAGQNQAHYLKDGKDVVVPGEALFGHRWKLAVPGAGEFEAYPNRDSMPYVNIYGLAGVRTMFRGTLRNPGWCETLEAIAMLGLLKDEPIPGVETMTAAAWLRRHVSGSADLRAGVAAKLGLPANNAILTRLAWLGMFDETPLGLKQGSDLDVLAKLMLDRMAYKPGERDMIVLHHEFEAEYPDRKERILSTLVDFGIPNGDSAMARTVSLPAAVAVRMILSGGIKLTGVHIPVDPAVYEPVLAELAGLGVKFTERTQQVQS